MKSYTFGLACLPIGLGFGIFYAHGASSEGWGWLPVSSSISAFLAGTLCWKIFIKNRPLTYKRSAMTGLISAVVGNFLTFYLLIVSSYFCFFFFDKCKESLGDAPMNPIQAIAGALVYSAFGLFLRTWITLLLGAFLGCIFCFCTKKRTTE